jgi:hypothetical protein
VCSPLRGIVKDFIVTVGTAPGMLLCGPLVNTLLCCLWSAVLSCAMLCALQLGALPVNLAHHPDF